MNVEASFYIVQKYSLIFILENNFNRDKKLFKR